MFEGFSPQLPDILARLKNNQTRGWDDEDHELYHSKCVEPCQALIEAMVHMGSNGGEHYFSDLAVNACFMGMSDQTNAGEGSRRNYLHLKFEAKLVEDNRPAIHLIFSSGGFGIGAGLTQLNSKQKTNFLASIKNEEKLETLRLAIEGAKSTGCFLEAIKPQGQVGKKFTAAHLKTLKGVIVRNRNESYPDGFFDDRCVETINNRIKPLVKLQNWLVGNLYD